MHNNSRQNNIYDSLISSIGELHNVTESLKKDKDVLSSFTDYLNQNEAEISKFGKASGELFFFLNNYDFSKGFLQIGSIHKKVKALHPLRLKLVKMGEEAKKLSFFPDRYGSQKAIEVCKKLAVTCMERMSLDETSRVSELVEANTEKLLELQKKFDGDRYILEQIKDEIEANKSILVKFKVYFGELMQYVDGFPHAGEDNLAVVKKRIETVLQLNKLIGKVGNTINEIQFFCNRYNKDNVVMHYNSTIAEIYAKMCFSNAEKYCMPLNDILNQATAVINAFEKEEEELGHLQATLKQKKPDIWKEDNERLGENISKILAKSPRKVSFDLNVLKRDMTNAKADRSNLISNTLNRYSWLNNSNYHEFHSRLLSNYMYSSEYLSEIETARKERIMRILKTVGKVLLYTVGIPVVLVGGLFYLIFSVIFGSSDD